MRSKAQIDPGGIDVARQPPEEDNDPFYGSELAAMVDEMAGALKEDMVPLGAQMKLFEAMSPTAQRAIVGRYAGLEANILMTFQYQTQLVEGMMRRMFNEDGTPKRGGEDMGMTPKDAMNLMVKNSQMIIRDLSKVYNAARAQRIEKAMFTAIETLPKDSQNAFLDSLAALTSKQE